jgi:hypothetical protein
MLLLQAALKQYPQWSEAFKLAEQTGWPVTREESDITMFVPSEWPERQQSCSKQ